MLKTAGRWVLYVLLFFMAAGAIEKGPAGAIGVLAAVIAWAAYKVYPILVGIRDALDRLSRDVGASDRFGR